MAASYSVKVSVGVIFTRNGPCTHLGLYFLECVLGQYISRMHMGRQWAEAGGSLKKLRWFRVTFSILSSAELLISQLQSFALLLRSNIFS